MRNLAMSGHYFSLETVVSEIYAKFSIRMMLTPNSTHDVRMNSSLPEWSLDYIYVFFKASQDAVYLNLYRSEIAAILGVSQLAPGLVLLSPVYRANCIRG